MLAELNFCPRLFDFRALIFFYSAPQFFKITGNLRHRCQREPLGSTSRGGSPEAGDVAWVVVSQGEGAALLAPPFGQPAESRQPCGDRAPWPRLCSSSESQRSNVGGKCKRTTDLPPHPLPPFLDLRLLQRRGEGPGGQGIGHSSDRGADRCADITLRASSLAESHKSRNCKAGHKGSGQTLAHSQWLDAHPQQLDFVGPEG